MIKMLLVFGFVFAPFFFIVVLAEDGIILTQSSDCLSCDGTATLSSSLNGDVTYQWFDSNSVLFFSETNNLGSSNVSNLCPQVYFVEFFTDDDFESCIFNIQSSQTPSGESTTYITCNDAVPFDLFQLLGGGTEIGGAWNDPLGNLVSNIFTPNISIDGLYTYTLSEGGCDITSGVLVTTNNNADPGNTTTYLICDTYNPFFLTDLMGGTPDGGGTWYGPGNVVMDGWFFPEAMASSQFLYTIDTVPGCDPVSSAMFVVVNYLPDVGLDNEIIVCEGAPIFDMIPQLGGTPDITGQWFDENNVGVSQLFNPNTMTEGVYTYQINGDTPCPNQQSDLTIGFIDGVDAGLDASIALCESSGLVNMFDQLGGIPSTAGEWFDPSNNSIMVEFDPSNMIDGIYTYEVNGIGCIPSTAELTIEVEEQLYAGTDDQIDICLSQSILDLNELLSDEASQGGQWYDEGSNAISSTINLNNYGVENYTYLLEGLLCPDDESSFVVNIDELVMIGSDQDLVFCENEGVIDLSDFVDNPQSLDFFWTDLNNDDIAPNYYPESQLSDTYVYTLVSENSCPDGLLLLQVNTEFISFPSDTSSFEICTSEIVFNLNESLGGVDPNDGIWTTPLSIVTPNEIVLIESESGVYNFTSSLNIACPTSVIEVDLLIIEQLEAGENAFINLCADNEVVNLGDLLVNQNSNDGSWYYNNILVEEQFDPSINESGEYFYIIDPFGPCLSSEAIINIGIVESIIFNAGDDVANCSGSASIDLGVASQDNCTYTWVPDTHLSDGQISNPILDFNTSGETLVEIEYIVFIDNGVCSMVDTLNLTIYPLPNVDLGPDVELCEETNLLLSGGEGEEYLWSPNWLFSDNSLSTQQIEMNSTDLSISLNIENEFGCSSFDDLLLTSLELPHVDFNASPEEGCVPLEVQLFNLSENDMFVEYEWQFSNGTIDDSENPSYIFYEQGTHDITLMAIAENGCVNSLSINNFIIAHPVPISSFSFNGNELSVLNTDLELYNESMGATNYIWSIDHSNFSENENPTLSLGFTPDASYLVCLVASNEFQCTDTICKSVFIPGEFLVYVPNAFSPDNDGINDVFIPVIQGIDENEYLLQIFNRWGEIIFQTNDSNEPWIGNHQNSLYYVPDGTYIWLLNVKNLYSSEIQQFTGHITLFR